MVTVRGSDAEPHPERQQTDERSLCLGRRSDAGSQSSQGSEGQRIGGQWTCRGEAEGCCQGEVSTAHSFRRAGLQPLADSFPFSSGLEQSIADLASFISSTTKQLDETYYSVLEKLGALQTTIDGLKELAEHTRQLTSNFSTEANELVTDIHAQLDAFGEFEDQQKRIESLQSRIQTGRELIKSLSERVDVVSERIESWGQADREWQEKIRKRLKVVWVVTSVVVFLVLSLFIGSQYSPVGLEETTAHTASDGLHTPRDVPGGSTAEVLISSADPVRDGMPLNFTGHGRPGISSATTDMLRVFDEL